MSPPSDSRLLFPTPVIDYPNNVDNDIEIELHRDFAEPLGCTIVRMKLLGILPDSPAETSGMRKCLGLSLLEVDGIPVNSESEFNIVTQNKTALCLKFGLRNTINIHRLGNEPLGATWNSTFFLTDVVSNSAAFKVGVDAFLNHRILLINGQSPNNSGVLPRGTIRMKFGHRYGCEPTTPPSSPIDLKPVRKTPPEVVNNNTSGTVHKHKHTSEATTNKVQRVPPNSCSGSETSLSYVSSSNASVQGIVSPPLSPQQQQQQQQQVRKTVKRSVRQQPKLDPKIVSAVNEIISRQDRTEKILSNLVSSLKVPLQRTHQQQQRPPPPSSTDSNSSEHVWTPSLGSQRSSTTFDGPIFDNSHYQRQPQSQSSSKIKSIEIDLHQGKVWLSHQHNC